MEETKIDLYYEDKKILNVDDIDDRTKRVTLELDPPIKNADGTEDVAEKITLMDWELQSVGTNVKSDASEGRNSRANYIVDKLWDLLLEHNVATTEISFILQKLLAKMSGVESKVWLNVLGVSEEKEVRLGHWQEKL